MSRLRSHRIGSRRIGLQTFAEAAEQNTVGARALFAARRVKAEPEPEIDIERCASCGTEAEQRLTPTGFAYLVHRDDCCQERMRLMAERYLMASLGHGENVEELEGFAVRYVELRARITDPTLLTELLVLEKRYAGRDL